MVKTRNPLACLPIMRKGGVHQKANSATRASQKRSMESEIDEYFDSQKTTQAKTRFAGFSGESDSYYFNSVQPPSIS